MIAPYFITLFGLFYVGLFMELHLPCSVVEKVEVVQNVDDIFKDPTSDGGKKKIDPSALKLHELGKALERVEELEESRENGSFGDDDEEDEIDPKIAMEEEEISSAFLEYATSAQEQEPNVSFYYCCYYYYCICCYYLVAVLFVFIFLFFIVC